MSRNQLDAIVVGAGPVGAVLALALARDGFEIALVEAREPKPWRVEDEVDARVVALAPDARELLGSLDVWTAIASQRASAYRQMRVWDASSPGELHFDAAERGEAALGWIVENRLVQCALWQECQSAVTLRVLCPAEVVEVENGDDAMVVTLTDGTRLRAKLLVAVEGAESSLRGKLGIAFEGRDYGQRALVAHVATERSHESTAWQRFRPGGPLAFLPLSDGRSSIVWSLPEAEAARMLALDDGAFRAELGCAFDFRLGAITATTPRLAFPLRLRLAERYVSGRCALVGDAAHVVHPLAGQGMNLGFRDVACLRRVLHEARERGSDAGAAHVLRRYERERRSENTLAACGFDAIQRVFGTDLEPFAFARGAALAAVGRLGLLKQAVADLAAGR